MMFCVVLSENSTVQLQHHALHRLPTYRLIFIHVIESLVFVPVSIYREGSSTIGNRDSKFCKIKLISKRLMDGEV
jgi:hypothetical protein